MNIKKDEKKKGNKLLKYAPYIIGGIIGGIIAWTDISLDWIRNMNFLAIIITIFIWGFIEINIHEFGHFVFGKKAKFKLIKYAIGCLYWKNENNKFKVQIKRHKGYGGFCAMTPQDVPNKKELVWFVAGGVIFNTISLSILILSKIFLIQKGSIFMDIANGAIIVNLLLTISNALPIQMQNISTDGRIIYSILKNKSYGEIFMSIIGYDGKITKGIRPRDIDIDLSGFKDSEIQFLAHINILEYYKYLDQKNYEKLKESVESIEENIKLTPCYMIQEVYNELIYYYSAIELDKEKCKQYYELAKKELVNNMSPEGRRAMAAYSIYIENDIDKGRKCIEEGLKYIHVQITKGQALMDEELLNDLANECVRV